MISRLFSAAMLAAVLASAPARAADPAKPSIAPTDSPTAGTRRTSTIGWAGLGFYNVGVSVDVPGAGTISDSSTYFGFHAGGSLNIVNLAAQVPLTVWADVALAFG